MTSEEKGGAGRVGAAGEEAHDAQFSEFRKKVKRAEVLSSSMERLVWEARFSGRISVTLQNGRVVKCGYEEGLFTRMREAG